VPGPAQALGHVAAHLAQPDQSQLHDVVPSRRFSKNPVPMVLAPPCSSDSGPISPAGAPA
jgi:hypothetical protein